MKNIDLNIYAYVSDTRRVYFCKPGSILEGNLPFPFFKNGGLFCKACSVYQFMDHMIEPGYYKVFIVPDGFGVKFHMENNLLFIRSALTNEKATNVHLDAILPIADKIPAHFGVKLVPCEKSILVYNGSFCKKVLELLKRSLRF